MKKFISHLMMLVFMTSFFACTSETEDAGGNLGNKVSVRMNFTGLNGFATSRAVDNTAIEDLTMYLFTGSDEGASLAYTLPVTLGETTANGRPGSFEVPEAGTYYMVAIANHTALSGIKTYADLLAQTTGTAIANNLIMQGNLSETVTLRAGGETKLTMELVRLAAMFQVTNESDLANVTFTLKDAVQTSYFVKHDAEGSFTIPADAQTGENTEPYAYENPASGTTMAISGTLNGATYKAEVPFGQVLRNHLYTVKLTKVGNEIKPTVTVTDWSTLSASMTINAGDELKMTATPDATDATAVAEVVYPATAPEVSQQTVAVPEEGQTYKLWVGSANIEAAVTNTTLPEGWTLTNPDGSSRADYLWQDYYYTLTIPANTSSDAKNVTITATNKLNDKATVSITFTLEGKVEEVDHSKNPLNKWAESNSINSLQKEYGTTQAWWNWQYQYATKDYPESDWANGVGSYYQWGRNAGFPFPTNYKNNGVTANTGGITWANVTYDLPSIKTANKTANLYLFIINGAGNDYVSNGSTNEIWTDRTSLCYDDNGANSYENPNPYPCPKGYRLPTVAEYQAIIPSKANQSLSFSTLTELKETEGVKYAIQWSYSSSNPTISGQGYSNEHVIIRSLVVPLDFTENQLSEIDWTNPNVVTRKFYTGGARLGAYYNSHSNPTNPAPVTFDWDNTAYYWTSESAPTSGTAWAMTFRTTRRTDDETGNYGPWFQIAAYPKDNAFNVRCVKAE